MVKRCASFVFKLGAIPTPLMNVQLGMFYREMKLMVLKRRRKNFKTMSLNEKDKPGQCNSFALR